VFLKKSYKTINGKTYNYYSVVESYREEGKIRHRILYPVGHLDDAAAERLKLVLRAHSQPDTVVATLEDIEVTKHLLFLDVAVLIYLWQQWNFDRFFPKEHWVASLIINRCIDPVAKFGIQEWLSQTVLRAYFPLALEYNKFDVYRELDHLFYREADLHSFLYERLRHSQKINLSAFFYDITSSFFTGKRCRLALFGYSRDHRADCIQIVIALLITPDGYPFYWQVMEGNTQDVTTIEQLVKDLKHRFKLENCTLVFDRGMVSVDNLTSIESQEWEYISAMDRDEFGSTSFFGSVWPTSPNENDWEQVLAMQEFVVIEDDLFYYREIEGLAKRYVITFDVARFLDERRMQKNRLKNALQWLNSKNEMLAKAKKSRKQGRLDQEVRAVLKRHRANRFLQVKIEPRILIIPGKKEGSTREVSSFQLCHSIDEQALEQEQRFHGITCFITNISAEKTSAFEIVRWYRDKNKVEEAFHEIKSHLDLRPIYLTRDKRVCAHVSICMLAYFLYNDMEKRLRESGIQLSTEEALKILAKCQLNRLTYEKHKSHWSITKVTSEQEEILKALGCESIVRKEQVKKIIEELEALNVV
jgi:transposase